MDTPSSRDTPRPVATGRDTDYTLSLEEVSEQYARAGHHRTMRTLQRYCVSGHLDAQKMATTLGDKYLVTPQSVARHIAQIEELGSANPVAASRDLSRQVATTVAPQTSQDLPQAERATGHDIGRQGTTREGDMSPYVEQLEKRIEEKNEVIDLLKGQLVTKDKQLGDLSDRFTSLSDRFADTQKLMGAMQRMLAPLLGQGDPYHAPETRSVVEDQAPSTPQS